MTFKVDETVYYKPRFNPCTIIAKYNKYDVISDQMIWYYTIDDHCGNWISNVKEFQIVSMQEYRKLKLEKLNENNFKRNCV